MHLRILLLALSNPIVVAAGQDLQVELLKTANWPNGLDIVQCGPPTWADFDGDGWADFFGARTGEVWRNLGGADWEKLPDALPEAGRYGAAAGDYDNDGFPDIATEPRTFVKERMILLRNLGSAGRFEDVTYDPGILDVVPWGDAETNVWADVDFDGNLDLFVPVYPPWAMNGPGNFFLHNLGPTGPKGAYRFTELSAQANLDNPPGTARPEGAEFCDVDSDGDLDLYSNGTLYQNRSTPGAPFFADLDSQASGIEYRDVLDEGVAFFDYDMDGDFDVLISWCGNPPRIRMLENRGDGRFFLTAEKVIENNFATDCIGVSHADWDGDGDVDFTTQSVFRRNMRVETGERKFLVASHPIPPDQLGNTAFAWADWDKDGDPDLLIGTFGSTFGYLYDNTLYGDATPDGDRRFVRVRVVRDSDAVERGLETEFGASVEVVVEGDAPGVRRRGLVSSAGGYVNQHEYVLHFGLPEDPLPQDPDKDLRFSLVVDFPSDPAVGLQRVDRRVNPALGRLDLADLVDREITVYRSGRAVIDGCVYEPLAGDPGLLATSTSGLVLTDDAAPLTDPVDAPNADWYVGVDFDTNLAAGPLRLKEVLFDGRADAAAVTCSGLEERLAVWDVTDPQNPFVVPGGRADLVRDARNHRAYVPLDAALEPARRYRVVARVDRLRATPLAAPVVDGPLTVHGGLSFQDLAPCDGVAVTAATPDPQAVFVAVRVAADPGPLWVDQGHALAGASGVAELGGSGSLEPGTPIDLTLTGGPPSQDTILVIGGAAQCLPLAGGILFPATDALVRLPTDPSGGWSWSGTVPPGHEPGASLHFQVWWADAGGPEGRAASNALSGTTSF